MLRAIAIVIELAVSVGFLWALSFLSTLFHECGHALGYLLATGDKRWHIRVGWGKRLLNTKRLTVNLLPFDGFFTPLERSKIDTTAKLIVILAGGPLASLMLVIGLLLIKLGGITIHSEVLAPSAIAFLINTALSINLFILIMSVIPTHYFHGEMKGHETDGLQIVNAIKSLRREP